MKINPHIPLEAELAELRKKEVRETCPEFNEDEVERVANGIATGDVDEFADLLIRGGL